MRAILSEAELQLIWSQGLFRKGDLMTEDSRRVAVEFPGIPSRTGGPDFKSARIRLDGRPVIGDIEMHLYPSGWTTHRHRENLEYANVVLHVALWRDVRDRGIVGVGGERIPQLVLEPFLDRSITELAHWLQSRYPETRDGPDLDRIGRLVDAAGDERLRSKVAHFDRLLRHASPDEVLYRDLMAALGYAHNKAQFEELATLAPFAKMRAVEKPEPVLLYTAGFSDEPPPQTGPHPRMDPTLWRHRGVRPSNYPERRIRAAAALLIRARDGLTDLFRARLLQAYAENNSASRLPSTLARELSTWTQGGVGHARALEIVFTILIPYFTATSKKEENFELSTFLYLAYSNAPSPPDNSITRYLKRQLFGQEEKPTCIRTARRYMGLLQWYSKLFE